MTPTTRRVVDRYLAKIAGGIDVQEDVVALLPGLIGSVSSLKSKDIAYAAYVFDYLEAFAKDSRVKTFGAALGTEYAQRFAEWLEYIFLNRANMTRQTKPMKALQEAIGDWVEGIPAMLAGSNKTKLSDFMYNYNRTAATEVPLETLIKKEPWVRDLLTSLARVGIKKVENVWSGIHGNIIKFAKQSQSLRLTPKELSSLAKLDRVRWFELGSSPSIGIEGQWIDPND